MRNWGTIGGSLCQADPSEDLSAAFAALKGSMIIAESRGHPGGVGAGVSHRALPDRRRRRGDADRDQAVDQAGGGSAYLKVCRRAGDWPIGAAGAAVWLAGVTGSRDVGHRADRGRRGRHFVAAEAEDFLRGQPADEESFARAGEIAAEHCRPVSDQRGPADYKRHLVRELTARVLRTAVSRARGLAP